MADTLTVDNWGLTEITLDYANQYIPDVLIANANDMQGRGIDLYVTKDGQALNMSGMTVYLAWSHENGNQDLTKFTATSSTSGHFRVKYPAGMMHAGSVVARIAINVNSSTITGSRDFHILVERDPIDTDKAMSDESWDLFKQSIAEMAQIEKNIETAEASRVMAEKSRVTAEQGRVTAEKARVAAETAREKSFTEAAEANSSALADFTEKSEAALTEAAEATSDAEQAASKANAAAADIYELMAGHVSTETQQQIDAIGTALAEATDEFYLIGTTIYAPSSKAAISDTTVTLPSSSYSGSTITLS